MAPKLRDISTISAFSILLSKDAEYTRVCGSSNSENNLNNSVLGMDTHADVSCAGRDAHCRGSSRDTIANKINPYF